MSTLNRKIVPQQFAISEIKYPQLEQLQLKNGLRLYFLEGGSQPILKTDVIIDAGAAFSEQHFLPHIASLMLSEGTKQHSSQKLAEHFDYHGAYFQSFADKDHSFSNLFTLEKHAKTTINLLKEVLTESTFPQDELETLLNRQRQKYQVEEEKTSYLARINFFEQLFGTDHPYGRLNKLNYLDEISREQLAEFYAQTFVPSNMKVMLSGNISDGLKKEVSNIFEQITSNSQAPNVIAYTKSTPELFRYIERKDAVQSSIRLGLKTVTQYHEDYLDLKILGTILGGYFGSRLMKNIREEKGLTYGIYATQASLQQIGYLVIGADVKANNTKQAIDEVKVELNKLRTELISQDELQLVRNFMLGELTQMLDGPIETSEALKNILIFNQGTSYFSQIKKAIEEITPEKIQSLAGKYLNLDEIVITVAGKYE